MRKRLLNEWIEDDRDYEDWELDEEHINLYGGDPTYCPSCHERLSYGDGYPHCLNPECDRYSPIDMDESLTEDTVAFNPRKDQSTVKRPTTVTTYRNKRNPHKKLDVRNDGYGHNSVVQYMHWKPGDEIDCGDGQCFIQRDEVINKTGDRRHHRWRKDNLNDLLDDYELDESVNKENLKEDKAVDVTINADELTNNGFATEIINLINATWDTIKSFKSVLVDVDTYGLDKSDEFKTIINTIIEDNTSNIGKLQAVVDALTNVQDVNQDIQAGVTEAEATIETTDDITDEDDAAIEITASEDDELDDLDEAFFNELLVDNHKN